MTTTTHDPIVDIVPGLEAATKRLKNISHPDFRESAARQAAALAWTGAEVAAELRENTAATAATSDALTVIADALTRQAVAAERTAAAAERTASMTHYQAMLALYTTPDQMLPGGVLEQFKAALGIRASASQPKVAQTPDVPVAAASAGADMSAVPLTDFDEFA